VCPVSPHPQVLFRIDKTPPMLFGGKSAKDLYVGMPDRTSGKERGSANKKELRKVNEDSRQKSSEQLEAEAEEEQVPPPKANPYNRGVSRAQPLNRRA
jgi:hypothetical protein